MTVRALSLRVPYETEEPALSAAIGGVEGWQSDRQIAPVDGIATLPLRSPASILTLSLARQALYIPSLLFDILPRHRRWSAGRLGCLRPASGGGPAYFLSFPLLQACPANGGERELHAVRACPEPA